jgi:hypothetical protein
LNAPIGVLEAAHGLHVIDHTGSKGRETSISADVGLLRDRERRHTTDETRGHCADGGNSRDINEHWIDCGYAWLLFHGTVPSEGHWAVTEKDRAVRRSRPRWRSNRGVSTPPTAARRQNATECCVVRDRGNSAVHSSAAALPIMQNAMRSARSLPAGGGERSE